MKAKHFGLAGFAVLGLLSSTQMASATRLPSRHHIPVLHHYTLTGIASWYGDHEAGRPTANGETFDPAGLTCASLVIPIGSIVHVTNLQNGSSVRLRVNDHGPYIKPRILDLTVAAAKRLGFLDQGLTVVRIKVVRPAPRKPRLFAKRN